MDNSASWLRSGLTLWLALMLMSSQVFAEPFIQKTYPSDHFAMSIPSGWTEMSRADLDELTAALPSGEPNAPPRSLSYGFQSSPDAPFPRILVQVSRTGRMSEDALQRLLKTSSIENEVTTDGSSSGSDIASRRPHMRQLRWDAEAAIFWTEVEVLSPEGVSMIVLTGMHPTEFGAVTIYCQDTKSHFDEFGPTFEAVIGSVKVDTQFRYRERSLFARAAESITLPALIGSGCAFALYGILLRRRRAKRNSPDYVSVRSSGAVWKIVLGFVLVFGHLSSLMHALDGDGWLQTSAEAQGYWFAWGLFVTIGLLLLYSAAAALHSRSSS